MKTRMEEFRERQKRFLPERAPMMAGLMAGVQPILFPDNGEDIFRLAARAEALHVRYIFHNGRIWANYGFGMPNASWMEV